MFTGTSSSLYHRSSRWVAEESTPRTQHRDSPQVFVDRLRVTAHRLCCSLDPLALPALQFITRGRDHETSAERECSLQFPQEEQLAFMSFTRHSYWKQSLSLSGMGVPSLQKRGPNHLTMMSRRWGAAQGTRAPEPSLRFKKKKRCPRDRSAVPPSTSQRQNVSLS